MLELVFLRDNHAPALDRLCSECSDYYEAVTGLPPWSAEAQSLFLAIPPHGDYDKKRLWGLFDNDHLYGVIDGAFDHPSEGYFWIGLMMLEPKARGRGRGGAALATVADHANQGGAHTLSLAVRRDYRPAHRFWTAAGFQVSGERILVMPGSGPTLFDVMDRAILTRPPPPFRPAGASACRGRGRSG